MDNTTITILIFLIIGTIVSLVFGIRFLIKYKATRKKSHLILGIVLTFVVPAILLYFAFRFSIANTSMIYGPGIGMDYGPGPA
ncbi:hypothetical protein CMI46_00790 [Candidatus Pacearchaeota archaeon]|nr:hypothetical protein [Candidatus Pacearchaeota archaeon]|tara:strand:- start:181 stop:429 length:249 start_codon:yes stop_codon:yes gene_type:complete